jgi:guanylate kinase
MARLVLLSGPSGIGKSPLLRAVRRFYPDLAAALEPLTLFTDRPPRPGERDGRDYFFRSREVINRFVGDPEYVVMPVRRDLQALHLPRLKMILESGRQPFFEGNPYIAKVLLEETTLAAYPKVSCFLSPLSAEEITSAGAQSGVEVSSLVADVMRQKLTRRTQKLKGQLTDGDRVDIEARCSAAWAELHYAPLFDWVLPNHDGEDSENWEAFGMPLGDARRCLLDLAAILASEQPRWAEQWTPELLARTGTDNNSSNSLTSCV